MTNFFIYIIIIECKARVFLLQHSRYALGQVSEHMHEHIRYMDHDECRGNCACAQAIEDNRMEPATSVEATAQTRTQISSVLTERHFSSFKNTLSDSTDQQPNRTCQRINNSNFASKNYHQGTAGSPTSYRVRVSLDDTVGAHCHHRRVPG